jgi:hypothetical protein
VPEYALARYRALLKVAAARNLAEPEYAFARKRALL